MPGVPGPLDGLGVCLREGPGHCWRGKKSRRDLERWGRGPGGKESASQNPPGPTGEGGEPTGARGLPRSGRDGGATPPAGLSLGGCRLPRVL